MKQEREDRRAVGTFYEEQAALFLERQGMRVIARNVNSRYGEIDLVAVEGQEIAFVEVKYRATDSLQEAKAAVTVVKQERLRRTARDFLRRFPNYQSYYARFDVIAINGNRLHYLKQAFM